MRALKGGAESSKGDYYYTILLWIVKTGVLPVSTSLREGIKKNRVHSARECREPVRNKCHVPPQNLATMSIRHSGALFAITMFLTVNRERQDLFIFFVNLGAATRGSIKERSKGREAVGEVEERQTTRS